MPRTLTGLFWFAVTATLTVIVGTYIYNKVVGPTFAKVMAKAA